MSCLPKRFIRAPPAVSPSDGPRLTWTLSANRPKMLAKPCAVTSQRAAPCSRNSSGLAHEFPLTTIGRSVPPRFFGPSGLTPHLVPPLPHLPVPVLLAAGLVAVVAWVWTDRQRTPVSSHPGPEASLPVQDPAALDAAQQLLDRAILTLEGHRSISAKIRQSGSLYGQEPIGSGVYLQQRVGNNLLFRSDLRIQLGEQTDRKSTRLNSSHIPLSRMPSSA